MSKLKTVAVLDGDKRLIGSVKATDGIDFGDLPLNGSYKYDEEKGQFVPLGFGFCKIKVHQPYSNDFVMRRIIDALGDNAPIEAKEWAAWYDENLRRRDEENAIMRRKR